MTSFTKKGRISLMSCLVEVNCLLGCSSYTYSEKPILDHIRKLVDISSNRVAVDDHINMHYIEAGSGKPLILIHGWLCSGPFWEKQLPVLAKSFHVYAIDLIGNGFSDKPMNVSYDTVNQARWIKSFMNALSIDQSYIVGHSLGGQVALQLALDAPEKVEKLVLVDAVGLSRCAEVIPFCGYALVSSAYHILCFNHKSHRWLLFASEFFAM